jgi:hypothetical protein
MRWFWLGLYKTSRAITRLAFGLGHKVQWLGWKAYDKAGLGSSGVVRSRVRKPLTSIWRWWRKVVARVQS